MIPEAERRDAIDNAKSLARMNFDFHGESVAKAIGADWDRDAECWRRLGELMEPHHECVPDECPINVRHDHVDREALLKLADEMDLDADAVGSSSPTTSGMLRSRAAEIREALGMRDA